MPSSSAMSRSSSLPERPTNGSPWRSSSRPGASPTNTRSASGAPTPNTTWVRCPANGHRTQTAACRASSARSFAGATAAWYCPSCVPRPGPARTGAGSDRGRPPAPGDHTGHPGPDVAQALVGDGAEQVGPLGGGDGLVPLPAEEHHLVPHLHRVGPDRSAVDDDLVHGDHAGQGAADPPDQHLAPLVEEPSGHPVAVPDGGGGHRGPAGQGSAPPV